MVANSHPVVKAGWWLLQQAGAGIFSMLQQSLSESMGLSDPPLTYFRTRTLLDEYLQRLNTKLDENRLAKLRGGLTLIKDASRSSAKRELLTQALPSLHEVVNLPVGGSTGDFSNSQLHCVAYLGMAIVHQKLGDGRGIIAEKIANAIYADPSTAKQWLDSGSVLKLLELYPAPAIGPSRTIVESTSYTESSFSKEQNSDDDDPWRYDPWHDPYNCLP